MTVDEMNSLLSKEQMRETSKVAQKMFKIRLAVAKWDDDRKILDDILDLYYRANQHSHYLAPHGGS